MDRVIHVSVMGVLLAVYLSYSVTGYLTFGHLTPDNILKAYDNTDNFALVGQA